MARGHTAPSLFPAVRFLTPTGHLNCTYLATTSMVPPEAAPRVQDSGAQLPPAAKAGASPPRREEMWSSSKEGGPTVLHRHGDVIALLPTTYKTTRPSGSPCEPPQVEASRMTTRNTTSREID